MLKLFIFTSLLFVFYAQVQAQTFSFGKFSIGESRIKAELSDFVIHFGDKRVAYGEWVADSVQWIRNENNLLVPRALLKVVVLGDESNHQNIHINYKNAVVLPFKKITPDRVYETEVYMDLFYPEIITIYNGAEVIGKISIEARAVTDARSKQLIDYSCSPYNLVIEGIDTEYLSVGCKLSRLGSFTHGTPRLEVTLSSTNLRTLNNEKPPFTLFLEDNSPVELKLKAESDTIKTFHLEANLPKRLYRLKTAIGFGPYIYQSEFRDDKQFSNLAPSVMLYAKFDLTETASFKAFDALLYSKSRFNNSGLYFSYDLADAFDGRILLNALLGFQGLHYKFSPNTGTEFHLIYPQGFELIYKHAFIENYNLIYGMFLSTGTESYTNAWLRYGKQSFIELNYIGWGRDRSRIKMWGISLGVPFISAF